VFGCPVYVLHPSLQDAKRLPKWQRKSWRGVFLGFSPQHSTNVALVLNPETGSISAHYHVVFDEKFSTAVSHVSDDSPASIVNLWDVVRDEGYEKHDCLQGSTASTLPPDIFEEPTVSANTDTNTDVSGVDPPSVPETVGSWKISGGNVEAVEPCRQSCFS
jgi:hypothetical protein